MQSNNLSQHKAELSPRDTALFSLKAATKPKGGPEKHLTRMLLQSRYGFTDSVLSVNLPTPISTIYLRWLEKRKPSRQSRLQQKWYFIYLSATPNSEKSTAIALGALSSDGKSLSTMLLPSGVVLTGQQSISRYLVTVSRET